MDVFTEEFGVGYLSRNKDAGNTRRDHYVRPTITSYNRPYKTNRSDDDNPHTHNDHPPYQTTTQNTMDQRKETTDNVIKPIPSTSQNTYADAI